MMQYRLSTLFVIFFFVAATLALFGEGGIGILIFLLLVALVVHLSKWSLGVIVALGLIFALSVALFLPVLSVARERHRQDKCVNNMKEIGQALYGYDRANGHFPLTTVKNKNGRLLYSWRVEILPYLGHDSLFDQLIKEESWDSSHNQKLLDKKNPADYGCAIAEYSCPNDSSKVNSSSYVAVIGPGTAWREEQPVKFSDLPEGGSQTVLLLETFNSDKHWGEPCDLKAETLIEQLKSKNGTDTLSGHPAICHVLFADGSVWCVPKEMPISVWQKLLGGEIQGIDALKSNLDESLKGSTKVAYCASAYDRIWIYLKTNCPYFCSIVVWLFSVFLLFRSAANSRKETMIETKIQPSP